MLTIHVISFISCFPQEKHSLPIQAGVDVVIHSPQHMRTVSVRVRSCNAHRGFRMLCRMESNSVYSSVTYLPTGDMKVDWNRSRDFSHAKSKN